MLNILLGRLPGNHCALSCSFSFAGLGLLRSRGGSSQAAGGQPKKTKVNHKSWIMDHGS